MFTVHATNHEIRADTITNHYYGKNARAHTYTSTTRVSHQHVTTTKRYRFRCIHSVIIFLP